MDIPILIKAAILGVVEGLTEFLPISSTGHLIIAGQLVGFTGDKAKLFEIVIQCGAILAVCWEYRARLTSVATGVAAAGAAGEAARKFLLNLFIAFLPLALLGLAFNKAIKAALFNATTVAIAFIVGGIIILWVERKPRGEADARVATVDDMTALDALKLGLAQACALVPGTSRSGATIIGGMLFGLSRKAATEFSFFLAIPTLFIASAYQLVKERHLLDANDISMWAVGLITAFASAFVCVKWLLRYISTHDFKIFAWYRIAFGIVVLWSGHAGWINWSA
jgi:undecaprenyl-diphosphatase